eukprot:scaffold232925_cov21-Tisochrysis_lutea.AAC.3
MALSASLTPQTAACKDVHTRSLDGTSQGHFKGRQGTSRGYSLDGTSQPAKRLKMLPARTHIHDEILCLQLRFDHIVKHTIVALDSVLVASGKTGLKISARWDNAGHTQHVLAKFLTVVEGRDLQTNGETLTAMQCDGVGTTYCRLVYLIVSAPVSGSTFRCSCRSHRITQTAQRRRKRRRRRRRRRRIYKKGTEVLKKTAHRRQKEKGTESPRNSCRAQSHTNSSKKKDKIRRGRGRSA